MKKLLLTGGCGFIGHHFVEGILKSTNWEIIILDNLSYSANLGRLADINIWSKENKRVSFIWWDLKSEFNDYAKNEIGKVDYIWHLAAGSHVDKSIKNPLSFAMDNVIGTINLLNFIKDNPVEKFIYFSTDEVFGPAPEGIDFIEGSRHNPGNPYAASKGAAEDFCIAYANTYKMPIMITNTMNVFGERQFSEKFIPLILRKLLREEKITVHNGSRYWIHARNVCMALIFITNYVNEFLTIEDETKGKFNIVGNRELKNEDLVKFIAGIVKREPKYEIVEATQSRPGHDKRYALSGKKLLSLGFDYPKSFEETLQKTISWMLVNPKWLEV